MRWREVLRCALEEALKISGKGRSATSTFKRHETEVFNCVWALMRAAGKARVLTSPNHLVEAKVFIKAAYESAGARSRSSGGSRNACSDALPRAHER